MRPVTTCECGSPKTACESGAVAMTVVDVAVPLHDTMVVDEKELAMQRYLGMLAVGV